MYNTPFIVTSTMFYAAAMISLLAGICLLYIYRKNTNKMSCIAGNLIGMLLVALSVVLATQGLLAKLFVF